MVLRGSGGHRTKLTSNRSGSAGGMRFSKNRSTKNAEEIALQQEQERACKRQSNLRQANILRLKATECVHLDHLAKRRGIATRDVLRNTLVKQYRTSKVCITLPVTIFYFTLFCFANMLHEDITNVFFIESAMRHHFTPALQHLETIADTWEWLKGDIATELFVQTDIYNAKLPIEEWSRVLLYSQVLGSVVLTQSRDNSDPWGQVLDEPLDSYTDKLNASNEGFVPVSSKSQGRRMSLLRPELVSSLTGAASDEATYEVMFYPTMPAEEIRLRMDYLYRRRWLDEATNQLEIKALMLNAELGRPRLEQLTILLTFSRGGGIFYRISLQCVFLAIFNGMMSMATDAAWVMMIVSSTGSSLKELWVAFTSSRGSHHLRNPAAFVEWSVIIFGWAIVAGFIWQSQLLQALTDAVQAVLDMRHGASRQELSSGQEALRSKELHEKAEVLIWLLGYYRVGTGWYNIILIFRFFFAFRAQPRLAVVTNTLKATAVDLGHFLVIFFPTLMAYVISGNILFGRRLEQFSTLQASFGVCARIVVENEYEWEELSEEHFWTTAVWVWSFLLVIVLIMLNMVLAITLDVYNEVRRNTDHSDTIHLFLAQIWKRLRHMRTWVKDSDLEGVLSEMDGQSVITEEDLGEFVPHMTNAQRQNIFAACSREMRWQAKQDAQKSNLLKLAASVKLSVDEANTALGDYEQHRDSNKKLSERRPQADDVADPTIDSINLFPGMTTEATGYNFPPLLPPEKALALKKTFFAEGQEDSRPEWFKEVRQAVELQNQWIASIQRQIQALQWEGHLLQMEGSLRTKMNTDASRQESSEHWKSNSASAGQTDIL